jgi:hypothetical protein
VRFVDEFRDGALGRKVAAQILGIADHLLYGLVLSEMRSRPRE